MGTAERTGLPDASASVIYGEAMLSMQPASTKSQIVAEAARLLTPRGRYGIHELCLVPDNANQATRDSILRELPEVIHVGVRPLTARLPHGIRAKTPVTMLLLLLHSPRAG